MSWNQTWWLNSLSIDWSMSTAFQYKKDSLLIGQVNVSHTWKKSIIKQETETETAL